MKNSRFVYFIICLINILFFESNLAWAKKNSNNTPSIKPSKLSTVNTVGNYFGLDLVNTRVSFDEFTYFNESEFKNYYNTYRTGYVFGESPTKNNNKFGFKYGYAVNFYDFFIMPEIFYNNTNLYANYNHGHDGDPIKNQAYSYKFLKLNKIYGTKINFGYDLNNFLSLFVSSGYAFVNYSALSNSTTYNEIIEKKIPLSITRKNKLTPIYGFGLKFKINENFNLFSEYQRINFKTSQLYFRDKSLAPKATGSLFDTKVIITKIGVSYNF